MKKEKSINWENKLNQTLEKFYKNYKEQIQDNEYLSKRLFNFVKNNFEDMDLIDYISCIEKFKNYKPNLDKLENENYKDYIKNVALITFEYALTDKLIKKYDYKPFK